MSTTEDIKIIIIIIIITINRNFKRTINRKNCYEGTRNDIIL